MNGAPCAVDRVIWMPVFVGAEYVTSVFGQIKTRDWLSKDIKTVTLSTKLQELQASTLV